MSRVIIPGVSYDKSDSSTYLRVHLKVQEVRSGSVLFEVLTDASDRMRWSVEWIGDKTVKLDSSDIGSYCWIEGTDGNWSESECP